MRYLSLFSGIEAATVAWEGLGWECVAVSEIDPFACAVLAHHYPNVPNLGSVTEITQKAITNLGHIDLVVFGSPCQNLSVAGNRKGLGGDQSGLFFDAIRVIQYARLCGCRFALWENVPGAFSSNKGRDFAAVVEHMAGLTDVGLPKNGWGKEGAAVGDNGLLEWACLDAQFFGLAQRRKRVFAIVDFGDWASRPPILLERQSLRGDIAPSRTARQDLAATAIGSTTVDSICLNPESPQCWRIYNPGGVSPTLQSGEKRGNIVLSKSTSPVPNYKAACFTHTSRDEVRLTKRQRPTGARAWRR